MITKTIFRQSSEFRTIYGLETCADGCVARSALLLVGAGAPTESAAGKPREVGLKTIPQPDGRMEKTPREREERVVGVAWLVLVPMRIMRSRDRTCSKYSCGAE